MTKEEIQKNSEHWYEKYKEVKHELEQERKLNAEIKARFVKCNTCTQEMKDKCLMFSENLCEGERCEELVDLMALVEKNDLQTKYELLGERCNQLLKDKGDLTDELAEWKDEWQEQVQKATDEGWERTKLTGRVRELEQQIEKMKCCSNCKHSRTEYEHCRTDKHEKWEIKEK